MGSVLVPEGSSRSRLATNGLPSGLGERARRHRFRELFHELYGPLEVCFNHNPLSADFHLTRVGSIGAMSCKANINRLVRTRHCVSVAGSEHMQLAVNLGNSPIEAAQLGRSAVLGPGGMTLLADAEPGQVYLGSSARWAFVQLPRSQLAEFVPRLEDRVAKPFAAPGAAAVHLRGYLGLLLMNDASENEALASHVSKTFVELVALLFQEGQVADGSTLWGHRRATRMQAILEVLDSTYRDPELSLSMVAERLRMSPRYVQALLHSEGRTFRAELLERRLQKAKQLLAERSYADKTVLEIALDSGFNDASHFSRAFRRRFGLAPSAARKRAEIKRAGASAWKSPESSR